MSVKPRRKRHKPNDLGSLRIVARSVRQNVIPTSQDEETRAGIFYDSPYNTRGTSRRRSTKYNTSPVNSYLHLPKIATVIAKAELGRTQQPYRHSIRKGSNKQHVKRESSKDQNQIKSRRNLESEKMARQTSTDLKTSIKESNERLALPLLSPTSSLVRSSPTSSRMNPTSSRVNPTSHQMTPPSSRVNPTSSRVTPTESEERPSGSDASSFGMGGCYHGMDKQNNSWTKPRMRDNKVAGILLTTSKGFSESSEKQFESSSSSRGPPRRLSIYLPMVNLDDNDF